MPDVHANFLLIAVDDGRKNGATATMNQKRRAFLLLALGPAYVRDARASNRVNDSINSAS